MMICNGFSHNLLFLRVFFIMCSVYVVAVVNSLRIIPNNYYRHYENQRAGEFVLYKHDTYPISVSMIYIT